MIFLFVKIQLSSHMNVGGSNEFQSCILNIEFKKYYAQSVISVGLRMRNNQYVLQELRNNVIPAIITFPSLLNEIEQYINELY